VALFCDLIEPESNPTVTMIETGMAWVGHFEGFHRQLALRCLTQMDPSSAALVAN
jgi:hypothetical protein